MEGGSNGVTISDIAFLRRSSVLFGIQSIHAIEMKETPLSSLYGGSLLHYGEPGPPSWRHVLRFRVAGLFARGVPLGFLHTTSSLRYRPPRPSYV